MSARCPTCFHDQDAAAGLFRCTGRCPVVRDDRASAYQGVQVDAGPAFPVPHQGGTAHAFCGTCGTRTTRALCTFCHAPLPEGWRTVTTTCVALAGASYAGKSVYIGVLVHQLRRLAVQLGGTLSAYDRETDQTYTELYERELFRQRNVMGPTPPRVRGDSAYAYSRPLLYALTLPGRPLHVVALRDVAGEDLQNPEIDPYLFGFFGRADAVLFLVDPLQVRSIREQLSGVVDVGAVNFADPTTVLSHLVRLMQRTEDPRPVPVALTLSKFDALQELGDVPASPLHAAMSNQGAACLRDPGMGSAAYDDADGRLLMAELASLLEVVGGAGLLNATRHAFSDVRLFAVSALGHAPRGDRQAPSGITPFRCLDPLKWVMARQGVVPVVGAP